MRQAGEEKEAEKWKTPPKARRPRRWVKPAVAAAACLAVLVSAAAVYDGLHAAPRAAGTGEVVDGADYGQIYQAVKALEPRFDFGEWLSGLFGSFLTKGGTNETGDSMGALSSGASGDAAGADGPAYSETNTQVEGVDEADVTKTDGRCIYTLSGGRLHIVRADGGTLEPEAEVVLPGGGSGMRALELYVKGGRLVVMQSGWLSGNERNAAQTGAAGAAGCPEGWYTQAAVYDIADPENPALLGVLGQAGEYLSSRLAGDTLYLVTTYRLPDKAKKGEKETYVPCLYTQESGAVMAAADVCIPPEPSERQYTVAASVDIRRPQEHLASKTVLGGGDSLYANTETLLLAVPRSVKGEEGRTGTVTDLLRFSLEEGDITLAASGTVPGTLLNQFSMDEYKGVFRVVTTLSGGTETIGDGVVSYEPWETVNCLYTLDGEMRLLGKVEGLAKGEQVYSVRFCGDIGYFVTFRQIDPLFAVDLTDPASPKVLSALKIPGFSEYLHPYAPGLLFGFGRQADPYTGEVRGLKLSMFDVSDPADVTEAYTLPLDAGWSEVSDNHKAILIDAGRNLIGFPADFRYFLYGYSPERGFYLRAELPLNFGGAYARGLYIGETFYTVEEGGICAYSLLDFQMVGSLAL